MELPSAVVGMAGLQKEPERLKEEAVILQATLEALYRENYVVFIENHECMAFLEQRGQHFYEDVALLQKELEGFKSDCQTFQKGAHEIVVDLKRNRQTLQHHLQLVELLEVPQLMDACIRNNLYEEAVEIVAFANILERRHLAPHRRMAAQAAFVPGATLDDSMTSSLSKAAKHTVVIAGLVQDLRVLQRQLRQRLLYQLRLPIQLPRCLQIISCLRKLDGLVLEEKHIGAHTKPTEEEQQELEHKLQVEFLEARDVWLQSIIDGTESGGNSSTTAAGQKAGSDGGGANRNLKLSAAWEAARSGDPTQYLMEVVEKNRTHWFEIATQFRAIFLDDDTKGTGSKTLCAWLLRRITTFIIQLESGLQQITDGASLVDVMEQCLFFGSSMSRIGVDFRELLIPIFYRAIKNLADLHWTAAVAELAAMLERCSTEGIGGGPQQTSQRLMGGAGGNGYAAACYVMPGSASIQQQAGADLAEADAAHQNDAYAPPVSVLSSPPLAQFTNLILTSFNQLRQCTPWEMVDDLERLFMEHIKSAVSTLAAHRQIERKQASQYKQLCKEAQKVVIPYLMNCFTIMIQGGALVAGASSAGQLKAKQTEVETVVAGVLAE